MMRTTPTPLRSLLALPALAAVLGCSSAPEEDVSLPLAAPTTPVTESAQLLREGWGAYVAYVGRTRINGVACGELDVAIPGDEIVTVDAEGRVRVIARDGFGFEEQIGIGFARDPYGGGLGGELVQVVTGDLDVSRPGDEVLAVGVETGDEDGGGPGVVRYYVRRADDGAWSRSSVLTDALVHAVAIGDLLPERPGEEFVIAGKFGEALIGRVEEATGVVLLDRVGVEFSATATAKGAVVVEDGFVLALDDGRTLRYERDDAGAWQLTEEVQHGAPLARIDRFGADEFVVCDNAGIFRLHGPYGDGGSPGSVLLDRRSDRLRGAVVADVDPDSDGVEACTAGYDGEITVCRLAFGDAEGDGAESPTVQVEAFSVARDTDRLHHLAVGEFEGLGRALVSCGYSGDVLVVAPRRR